jgi:hypothetical protein
MQDFIHKLKQKPEPVRRRIAVGTSVGITALVGIIWLGDVRLRRLRAEFRGLKAERPARHPLMPSRFPARTRSRISLSSWAPWVPLPARPHRKPSLTIIDGTTSSSFDQPARGECEPVRDRYSFLIRSVI